MSCLESQLGWGGVSVPDKTPFGVGFSCFSCISSPNPLQSPQGEPEPSAALVAEPQEVKKEEREEQDEEEEDEGKVRAVSCCLVFLQKKHRGIPSSTLLRAVPTCSQTAEGCWILEGL